MNCAYLQATCENLLSRIPVVIKLFFNYIYVEETKPRLSQKVRRFNKCTMNALSATICWWIIKGGNKFKTLIKCTKIASFKIYSLQFLKFKKINVSCQVKEFIGLLGI